MTPDGATPAEYDAFPYVPARWAQTAPYAISTGHAHGPGSGPGRRFVKVCRYASRGADENAQRYGIDVGGLRNSGPMTMLGPDGCLYVAAPMYKLHTPPTFDGPGAFEAAVEMAEAYAAGYNAPVVHTDTVLHEVHDYGAEATTRYGTRTLWNGEPATGPTFEDWEAASKAADRKNSAAKAARTRAARRAAGGKP